MINIVIKRSKNPKKTYDAVIDGDKIISFGASGYSDYTLHKDPARKENYIKRHSNEDWSRETALSPAWLSRYTLWEKPRLKKAIINANSKYINVSFKFKT